MPKKKTWYKRFSDLPMRDQRAVLAKTRRQCWYCGVELLYPHDLPEPPDGVDWSDPAYFASVEHLFPFMAEISHLQPRSKGGQTTVGNLVPACHGCNLRKRSRTVEEFRAYLKARGDLGAEGFWFEYQRAKAKVLPFQRKESNHEPC